MHRCPGAVEGVFPMMVESFRKAGGRVVTEDAIPSLSGVRRSRAALQPVCAEGFLVKCKKMIIICSRK